MKYLILKSFLVFAVSFIHASNPSYADSPVVQSDSTKNLIVLPPIPAPPAPKPETVVQDLTVDLLYIISADSELIIVDSPKGFIKLVSEVSKTGTIIVRGKFIDNPTKTETRIFKSKYLYFVEPIQNGQVELIVIPQGVKKFDEVHRRTINTLVTPPKPPDPPPGPTDPLQASFQSAYSLDKAAIAGSPEALVKLSAAYNEATASLLPNATSNQDLQDKMHNILVKYIGEGALPNLRNSIASDVSIRLGTKPADPIDLTKAKDTWQKISEITNLLK